MTRLTRSFLPLALALAATAPETDAAAARSWSASTAEAFAAGTLDGAALDDEGRIRLAPELTTLWGPDSGVVWAVAPDRDGAAFVALSGPGRVLRVGAGTEPELWFEAPQESLVTALAADGSGGVLFGLSPEGTVHRARRGRGGVEVEKVVETGALFVWALARGSDGQLWVGTGVPGRLLRVAEGEAPATVFDAGDDPVRSLAATPSGGLVLGTGGRGLVVRVDPRDDRAFVLLDADETEIVAVTVAADGTVFAVGTKAPKQPGPRAAQAPNGSAGSAHVVVSVQAGDPGDDEAAEEPAQQAPPAAPAAPQTFKSQPGGAVYRIDPDGTTRKIWETASEMPFGLTLDREGRLVVGTGDGGRVHALDAEGRSSRLLRIPSDQVSALAADAAGHVWLGGTSDARVELLGPRPRREGSYLTPPVDAGTLADWGRLLWDAEQPRGTRLRVQARSGNTGDPDDTWSPWSDLDADRDATTGPTGVPGARWFQARFTLTSSGDLSPALRRVEIAYQTRNRPPEVSALGVDAPGVVWVRGPSQSSFRVGPVVADDPVAREVSDALQRGARRVRMAQGPIRKTYEAGARTFSWTADDPDGDRLRFSLALRREGGEDWFELVRDLDEDFHSWDARAMPDGVYRARLTVDDALDNPNGTHRRAERVSDAFRVDNTRPSVERLEVSRSAKGHEVRFVARDPGGEVAAVEVALDGRGWTPLSPVDGVADSEVERYTLLVEPLAGETQRARTLIVRVTDASGNLGGTMWRLD